MYPRSFLCEEDKIKHHTFAKKKEIREQAVWMSRFTCLFFLKLKPKLNRKRPHKRTSISTKSALFMRTMIYYINIIEIIKQVFCCKLKNEQD